VKSLLKVTRKAQLGLLLVSELAQRPQDAGPLSIEEVAKKSGESRKFLEEVAGELRRAKMIEGVRGATGGYRLVRDAKTLTVAEVMNAVEGPMEREACTALTHHHDSGILTKVQGQVMATLMNTTIADACPAEPAGRSGVAK
jgi:Rrf2 family protein